MIDYVPEILKKYNYDLPKIPRYIFNERVKELGRRAKLEQKIEVVCTNMYLSGFPAGELMRISGHKSPSAFMRYIKVDNLQAAKRLKELRAKLAR